MARFGDFMLQHGQVADLPPPAAAQEAAVAFAAEIPLSKPIHTHTGDQRVLQLRMPTYGDLMDIGEIDRVYVLEMDPVTNRPTKMETTVDRNAVMRWAERLTDLGQIVLSQLAMKDGMALEAALRRIIGAAQKGN